MKGTKIYCHREGCGHSMVVKADPSPTCDRCGCRDMGPEQDGGWHKLSRLYAHGNGWGGPRNDERNLVQWFHNEKLLHDWKRWKKRLSDPKEFVPCPGNIRPKDFFLRPIEKWYGSRPRHELFEAYPILHQLCAKYEQWNASRRAAA